MNVLLSKRETGFYLKDPEAKVLFAWHGFAEAAEAGAQEAGRGPRPRRAGEVRAGALRRRGPARTWRTAPTMTPR
jgi:hypothetical protein